MSPLLLKHQENYCPDDKGRVKGRSWEINEVPTEISKNPTLDILKHQSIAQLKDKVSENKDSGRIEKKVANQELADDYPLSHSEMIAELDQMEVGYNSNAAEAYFDSMDGKWRDKNGPVRNWIFHFLSFNRKYEEDRLKAKS